MIDFNVLIPVYNTKPNALIEAVFSVINQKINQHYKILLVDDGSTDTDTLALLDYFQKEGKRGFCEVVVHHLDKNEGTSKALNYGHSILTSEWIAIMGSDDVCHESRFDLQTRFIKGRKLDVLGTGLFGFKNGDIERKPMFKAVHPVSPTPQNTKDGWMVNHGTVFYRNQAVKDAGHYNPALRRAQDVDLWKRMYAKGNVFFNLQEVLYGWRRY